MSGFRLRILGGSEDDLAHPIDTFTDDADAGKVVNVPVHSITPNPDQPRKYFDQQALDDLTASIREHGVLQPIIVRQNGENGFTLIAGERRWRASKKAGLAKIPVLIRQKEDPAEIALIENVQRENLNPIEEAESLALLKERRALTDQQLANIVGKSRVMVTESLSLTRLPEAVKEQCLRADTYYSKRQLLQVLREPTPAAQLALWEAIRDGGLSGGQARAVRAMKREGGAGSKPYEHKFEAEDRRFTVRVTFRKSRASNDDIRDALREALNALS